MSNDALLLRFETDFTEVELIGRGSYGEVFKARNKLDGRLYALKRVRLKDRLETSENNKKILREVSVLSALNHGNIVRYFNCWIEGSCDEKEDNIHYDDGSYSYSTDNDGQQEVETVKGNIMTCNVCESEYEDWEVNFVSWSLLDVKMQPMNLCIECYLRHLNMNGMKPSGNICYKTKTIAPLKYLYITMEYCDRTLVDLTNQLAYKLYKSDNNEGEDVLWDLYAQIISGLCHLHRKEIIHRDLSCANIFVKKYTVKIGDMGLAAFSPSLLSTPNKIVNKVEMGDYCESPMTPSHPNKSDLTSDLGTYFYSAPEIKGGKYDYKADIYSVGVILFEIFNYFSTKMERCVTLEALRQGIIPISFQEGFPLQSQLIKECIDINPERRPDAIELLRRLPISLEREEKNMKNWQSRVREQSLQILELEEFIKNQNEMLNKKDEEIEMLKKELQARVARYISSFTSNNRVFVPYRQAEIRYINVTG